MAAVKDDNRAVARCGHCQTENPVGGLTEYPRSSKLPGMGTALLCEICSQTPSTDVFLDHGDRREGDAVERAIIANIIRKDIRRLQLLILNPDAVRNP